jgi:integrase
MAKTDALSARKVADIKVPGVYLDGHGLQLQVSRSATALNKSWQLRYVMHGRQRYMGLGGLHTVSLAEARVRARQARQLILDGIDPIDARREARAAAKRKREAALTFKQCAERYHAAFAPTWRNEKHRAQWKTTIDTYALPILGAVTIDKVDQAMVLKVIRPLWDRAPSTANRLRGRIEKVLAWAAAQGLRPESNPAAWKGNLSLILPAVGKVKTPRRHVAMPYVDVPQFMAKLRGKDTVAARALEFTILTASRRREAVGARRSEIEGTTWVVPGERMKSGKPHRVPLCKRALEIIETTSGEGSGLIFPGDKHGQPLGSTALFNVLASVAGKGAATTHGFRAAFSTWARETTPYERAVVEMSLSHAVATDVEAAYQRGDLLERRRALMCAWSDYCAAPSADATVTPISDRRRRA